MKFAALSPKFAALSPCFFLLLTSAQAADPAAEKVFTQIPAIAPSQQAETPQPTTPAPTPPAAAPSGAEKNTFVTGPVPQWIWGADDGKNYYLRTEFAGGSKSAVLKASCDNSLTVWLNGQQVAASSVWQTPVEAEVQKHIKPGKNELVIDAKNHGGMAGCILKLALTMPDGQMRYVVTDDAWQVGDSKDAKQWAKPRVIGKLGVAPWKNVFSQTAASATAGAAPREGFNVPPGFQVELLFSVPKEKLGSWVSLTTDNRGRLISSDQGKLGLCRITPPAIGSSEPTKVEHLDVKISGAHGLLYAFDSLYVISHGGPTGTGLYRVKDTDNDDQFDEVVKLKEIGGGGEHGPHALRLSPDGKSIYVIGGNHTKPPFERKLNAAAQTLGGVRPEQLRAELPEGATSRLAPNWDEDVLLPRQWDANGHATGILAPGGWIAQTDPDGKTWEMFSVGYRNQYDMAFNADGELFAYDSDMEWDMGTPWYRATRVTHATSGSEFGWRSGTADWPWYYVDSLPPLIDIGPGSPVGVEFGYGAKFPAKFQKALFICDWTFGTMYAIHNEPAGASYKAVKEEFVSRTPLPLTDVVVGRDGALYFTVGGRGADSALFRVTYVGKESTAPVDAHDAAFADLRELRRRIETHHHSADSSTSDRAKLTAAVEFLAPHLGHADQHIRYAARVALERIPIARWLERVLNANDPDTIITGVVGLARQVDPALRSRLLTTLEKVDFAKLSEIQQLGLARAYQLVFIRLGLPEEAELLALGNKFDGLYPAKSDLVNRELAVLMVGVSSPSAAHKLVPILTRERVVSQQELGEVLARNKGYGGSIAAMLANQPDQQQLHIALTLRNLKKGWTPQEKTTYFKWFETAHTWSGGNSYQKFVTNIENDAYSNSSEIERLAIEAQGLRKPYKAPPLPKPLGPGRDYTLDELMALSQTKMQGRNYKNGQKMFAAARCVVCHRFGGDGGSTGPDLTQAAGRFNFKDLTEAIVDPSKVVSDQYRTTIIQTSEGKSYTGRIISLSKDSLTLLIDPEDASKIVEIKKADIETETLSPVSLMPKDLLKALNENEVLDMLAYLLSRGNPQDAMFSK